jgi:hypothetical protein
VSHRVSDRAAHPWRHYHTRYYTEATIATSQSAEAIPLHERTLPDFERLLVADHRTPWHHGTTSP